MDISLFDVFVQGIGFVGIALNIWAVQFNKHWQIVLLKTLGSLMFTLQYVFLKAYTGLAMDGIGIFRNLLFIFVVKSEKTTLPWIILFSSLTIALGVLTFEGAISLLAIVAKLLSCVSYGIKSPKVIRMLNLPSSACWLVYNTLHFTLAGILNEILVITSIIIAEIRFYYKGKKGNRNNQMKTASIDRVVAVTDSFKSDGNEDGDINL